jgi:hypothetical protein
MNFSDITLCCHSVLFRKGFFTIIPLFHNFWKQYASSINISSLKNRKRQYRKKLYGKSIKVKQLK